MGDLFFWSTLHLEGVSRKHFLKSRKKCRGNRCLFGIFQKVFFARFVRVLFAAEKKQKKNLDNF